MPEIKKDEEKEKEKKALLGLALFGLLLGLISSFFWLRAKAGARPPEFREDIPAPSSGCMPAQLDRIGDAFTLWITQWSRTNQPPTILSNLTIEFVYTNNPANILKWSAGNRDAFIFKFTDAVQIYTISYGTCVYDVKKFNLILTSTGGYRITFIFP